MGNILDMGYHLLIPTYCSMCTLGFSFGVCEVGGSDHTSLFSAFSFYTIWDFYLLSVFFLSYFSGGGNKIP